MALKNHTIDRGNLLKAKICSSFQLINIKSKINDSTTSRYIFCIYLIILHDEIAFVKKYTPFLVCDVALNEVFRCNTTTRWLFCAGWWWLLSVCVSVWKKKITNHHCHTHKAYCLCLWVVKKVCLFAFNAAETNVPWHTKQFT